MKPFGKSPYAKIMKVTALFGSVEFFNIVITIVRSKAVAILIGPAGMGVMALINSTFQLVTSCTSFGLERGGVHFIAQSTDNEKSRTVFVLRRLVWFSGLAGGILLLVFSSLLSHITFGSTEYYWAFAWLSAAVVFRQLTNGELAVLQGFRMLHQLAHANLIGNFSGLLVSVPLYYFYGFEAIVPAIIISSFFSLVTAWWFGRMHQSEKKKLDWATATPMLKFGLMLSLTTILSLLTTYLSQLYVSYKGGTDQVGLFNAGFTLLTSYVGVLFTAMATDFFPSLSAIASDDEKVGQALNLQIRFGILLLTPVIVAFLGCAPWIVRLLFSEEFLGIVPMVSIGIIGMLFRSAAWSMDYVLLAKGKTRVYVGLMIGLNVALLLGNIIGYQFYGLVGLGVAFLGENVLHWVVVSSILRGRRHSILVSSYFSRLFFGLLQCLIVYAALTFQYLSPLITNLIILGIFSFTVYRTIKELRIKM